MKRLSRAACLAMLMSDPHSKEHDAGAYSAHEHHSRHAWSGQEERAHKAYGPLTREQAEAWVSGMESADPAKPHGGKWTMDQVKPVAQKYGVPTEGEKFAEFWAVMNALYSDYYAVAKKYNVLNPDFFADMAMAWIQDADAVENKASVYYECIVEK